MGTIANLLIEIGVDPKGVSSGLGKIQSDINKTAGGMKNLGKSLTNNVTGPMVKATATIGAAIGGLAIAGLNGAADLESYRNTLNTVMKDSQKAGEMLTWAVEFANRTPFETTDIVQATVRLSAYGISAKETMTEIGNMASVMDTDLMQAVEAVADAQTGSLERLKEFGITKEMIVKEANKKMAGIEIVNAKGQITNQEKFNETLFSLMKDRFAGGMDVQANSFKGLMSTVKGTFSSALTQMMGVSADGTIVVGGMFDTIKGKMKLLIDKLAELQKDGTLDKWAKQVGDSFTSFIDTMQNDVIPVLSEVFKAVKSVVEWFLKLPKPVQEASLKFGILLAALGPLLSGAGSLLQLVTLLQGVAKASGAAGAAGSVDTLASSCTLALGPIALVAAALGGLLWLSYELSQQDPSLNPNMWNQAAPTYQGTANNLLNAGQKVKQTTNLGQGGSRAGEVTPYGGVGGFKAYAMGTDYVPKTGLALLHKGEAVIPASRNNAGNPISISITGNYIANERDIDRIGNQLVKKLKLSGVRVG